MTAWEKIIVFTSIVPAVTSLSRAIRTLVSGEVRVPLLLDRLASSPLLPQSIIQTQLPAYPTVYG
jgi:hypothetical protein